MSREFWRERLANLYFKDITVWKYNVRMDIRVIGCEEEMWMDLAEDVV